MSMGSVNHICHLCEEDDVSNVAVVWCADCETFLCKDCEKHHSKNRASKRHQTLSLESYEKLPSFIFDINSRCKIHDEKYDFYCHFHGDPCCFQCIKNHHKDCRDLDPLVDVLRNIKSSAQVSNLEREFDILIENFETVAKHLNSKLVIFQDNRTVALKEIKNLRASIDKHLDEIEKKMVDTVSVEFNRMKLKFDQYITEIEDKKKLILNFQNDLSRMTAYATDLQMYGGLQFLEKSTSQGIEYLRGLQREGELRNFRLETLLDSNLKCLTNKIKTFGTAHITGYPCTVQLKTSSEYQVHLALPTVSTINSIRPILITTLKIPKTISQYIQIEGCQILPDGRILLLNGAISVLHMFSKDGIFTENVISFKGRPTDICYIKGKLIAVTFQTEKEILLIDISLKIIIKTIKVADTCYGIDSNGEILVVNLLGSLLKLLTLDLDGNILSEISVPGKHTIYSVLYKETIICSDWHDNAIFCYTNKGTLLWTYKHDDICQPAGLTIDKHGFIYVASRKTDKIVVISKDGKTSKIILSEEQGIVFPTSLSIDKSSSTLLVPYRESNAFVFEI